MKFQDISCNIKTFKDFAHIVGLDNIDRESEMF